MQFSPRNRHLYIEIVDQKKEEEPQILLPEDYKPIKEEYILARLIDWAPDCNGNYLDDDIVVVKQNMIEEIKTGKEIFHLVLENYVMGVLEEEESGVVCGGSLEIN
tara:strand:+ start:3252 stop:3569 length:318 start_codon:yes stop_codon:yes gene_type:complete